MTGRGNHRAAVSGKELAQRIKNEVRVSKVVGIRVKLSASGRGEMEGLCPFHKEKTPSFTVNDDKGFYHCFGCGAHGSVIDFVMEVEGLTVAAALQKLSDENGITILEESPEKKREREEADRHRQAKLARKETARRQWALDLFEASRVANRMATPIKPYLEGRGLDWDVVAPRLHALGFVAAHKYLNDKDPDYSGTYWPTIVSGMQIYDPSTERSTIQAVHRTYLEILEPGQVIKAPVQKTKKVLAPGTGSAIRFARAGETLRLAEGIETSLSILQALEPDIPVWAAGSLDRMSSVILPPVVKRLELWTDNDMKDDGGLNRMLARALEFYGAGGVKVYEHRAPKGRDWNDVLVGKNT